VSIGISKAVIVILTSSLGIEKNGTIGTIQILSTKNVLELSFIISIIYEPRRLFDSRRLHQTSLLEATSRHATRLPSALYTIPKNQLQNMRNCRKMRSSSGVWGDRKD
jgi:hypothetical protein